EVHGLRAHGNFFEFIAQSQAEQNLHCAGAYLNTRTNFTECVSLLIDADLEALLQQGRSGYQPAEPSSSDHDLQYVLLHSVAPLSAHRAEVYASQPWKYMIVLANSFSNLEIRNESL